MNDYGSLISDLFPKQTQAKPDERGNILKSARLTSPAALDMAERELNAGTPIAEVQRKLLDIVAPLTGWGGRIRMKDVSVDLLCRSIAEPANPVLD